MSLFDRKGYFPELDGGGTTSGMTAEELRRRELYLLELAQQEGISYERPGMTEWLGEIGSNAMNAVGAAVNNRVQQFAQTPTGEFVMNRVLAPVGRALDAYEQGYMKPAAMASQFLRGNTGAGALSGSLPFMIGNRLVNTFQNTNPDEADARLLELAQGDRYQPSDVTNSEFGDTVFSMVADPSNYLPGVGAVTASARRGLGLIDNVTAPGLREVAERAQDTVLTPVRKPARTPAQIQVNENIQAAVDTILPPEDPLSNPEIKRRFDHMIRIGNEYGAARWYGSPVIRDLFSRALSFLSPADRQREVQGTLAMFSVLNGATSPQTKVFENINKALTLLTNAQAGRQFSDLVRMAEENPHVSRKTRRSGPPYKKNKKTGEMVGTTVTPEDEMHMRLTSPYDLEMGLGQAMFPSLMTRQAFESGTLSGQKTSSFDLNVAADEANPNHQVAVNAVTIDTHFLPQFLWGLGMDYRTEEGRRAITRFLDLPNETAYELSAEKFDDYMYDAVSQTPRYSVVEQAAQRVASAYNLKGRDFQSVLWVGGKEISHPDDLRPFSATFMENMQIHSQRLKISVEEVARRIATGDLRLSEIMGNDLSRYIQALSRKMSSGMSEQQQEEEEGEMGRELEGLIGQ